MKVLAELPKNCWYIVKNFYAFLGLAFFETFLKLWYSRLLIASLSRSYFHTETCDVHH